MADRRDEIVNIAVQLFAHRGFEATTIREIAKAANILSGSLYHHFNTKEDILREAVTPAIQELRRQTIAISESSANPEAKLIAFVELELGEQIENYHAHAVLYNERRLFRTRVEFEQVYQAKREIYRVWFAVLEEGMSQGLFDSKLDRYQTIRTIIRMLNSAAEWFASGEETLAGIVKNYSLAEVQDFYLRFILAAVRTAERVAEPIGRNSAMRLLTDSSDKLP
jgi:TetR/AcrR family transcriptional regulator, cholesterol catabolism regulator